MVNLNSVITRDDTGRPIRSTLYVLAVLCLTAGLCGLGLAYGLKAYFSGNPIRTEGPVLIETHQIAIGAQRYAMPAGLMTDPLQRRDGFAERIDLKLALPLGESGKLADVDITLMPRGRVRSSAALLDSVYVHQFGAAQLSGPPGLVGKPLQADAGTRGETVWYDPLSANPFAAKCMTPINMTPDERTCIRVVSLGDRNTAIVTFAPAALGNWRSFDATVEQAIAALRL